MFTTQFSRYDVLPGDSITCTVDGTDYTARIEFDPDTHVNDCDCYSPEQIKSWMQDDWSFVGVVISAERDGVCLGEHLASLWGIESNSSPDYFIEVANELLAEAIPEANEARKRIVLAMAS